MTLRSTTLLALSLLLGACAASGGQCPEGTTLESGACVPIVPADMGASADGGGCPACADSEVCDAESGLCVACRSDHDCGGTTPRCWIDAAEPSNHRCVACADDADCPGTIPVCDANSHECRGCAEHSECEAGLCALGACPAASDIVWVDKDDERCSDAGDGSSDEPFCEVSAALGHGRVVAVRDSAEAYGPIVWLEAGAVTVVAAESGGPLARLEASGDVEQSTVTCGLSTLHLVGLSITGDGNQHGVDASSCTVTLADVTVAGNGRTGVWVHDGSTLTLTDSMVSDHRVGTGVSASSGSTATLENVTLSNNRFYGVGAFDGSTLTLMGGSVSRNGGPTTPLAWGGVSLRSSTATLTDVTVSNNLGRGVEAVTDADITIRRSVIRGNDLEGLLLVDARIAMENTRVTGNGRGATTPPTGGVHLVRPLGGSRFVNDTITDNQGVSTGGVFCGDAVSLANSLVWGNIATDGGGADEVSANCGSLRSYIGGENPLLEADGFHLSSASTCCIDQGAPSSAPTVDLDGDERPCGDGVDIGADELCP